MISSLRGTVLSALGGLIVIEVGGVGFTVQVTPECALRAHLGHEVRLHTSLIVREDALSLVGFDTVDELQVFEQLVGVTGVGPKSALGVLAVLAPADIAAAVANDDDAAFRKVSGIGPKTAKLIVLSLTGKLGLYERATTAAPVSASGIAANVVTALVGLGWSERVAAQVVEETMADAGAEASGVPAILRIALSKLGPAQQTAGRL